MKKVSKIFGGGDKIIWIIFLLLSIISFVEIYSANIHVQAGAFQNFNMLNMQPVRQVVFLITGLVVAFAMQFVKPKLFSRIILLLPLIWIGLIVYDRSYDRFMFPFCEELAKICLITAIAFFLSDNSKSKLTKYYKLAVFLSIIITCGLISLTSLSMATILFIVTVTMLFFSIIYAKKILVSLGIVVFAIGLFIASLFLAPEHSFEKIGLHRAVVWQHRLINCSEKTTYDSDFDNYIKAPVEKAIASGGIAGVFPGNGHLPDNIKPLAYYDFIYGNIIEEMGILGGLAVLALYLLLLWRSIVIARRCRQSYNKLLIAGSALMITIPAFINMGQTTGLIPLSSTYLPLISFGFRSVISTCIFFGIILSAGRFENIKNKGTE
ncbi:MAG: FtsW/RodA/SpoVE family cell cycle protein [Dysgonamonadaceae bacterium]|nr:FtsW/RodA/SpoVE family cell cycle protein [Dysgonamonadaceae bacterium]